MANPLRDLRSPNGAHPEVSFIKVAIVRFKEMARMIIDCAWKDSKEFVSPSLCSIRLTWSDIDIFS